MFSILIPTLQNFNYLKLCIESLKKNSTFNNQIIVHVNENNDQTLDFLNEKKIEFTISNKNIGMPASLNIASSLANKKYVVISHDDFYFCPNWDDYLYKEIKSKDGLFLYTGLMIGPGQPLEVDYGSNYIEFNETKLLNEYNKLDFHNFTGSTKHPAILKRELWNAVGGWSEEFFPTGGDDTDFLVKLWNYGVRDFKGVHKSRVYHFGSITTRKKNNSKKYYLGSKANKIFVKKWGFSINFFENIYLKSGYSNNKIILKKYDGPTQEPKKNFLFYLLLIIEKFKYLYYKNFY